MGLFTLGIDLGKTTFHVVGMNQRGEVVLRKRFSRVQLLHFTANLKVKLIGMEACGGSHVGTATVSFSRTIGGAIGAAIVSAVLLGALQVFDPNARTILTQELSSVGSSRVDPSQIATALMAAYRWVFLALGGLSGCAAVVAWSIPNLDLAASPASALATPSLDRD
jgi:hypothetical protein